MYLTSKLEFNTRKQVKLWKAVENLIWSYDRASGGSRQFFWTWGGSFEITISHRRSTSISFILNQAQKVVIRYFILTYKL